ncbi:MAG: Mur ligase family protein, partial [Candidatus Methanomethylophilaceae archaeon]
MTSINKEDALRWLYGLSVHGIKLGLINITELLKRVGNPQNSFRSIHVAGTDGKGSTCAMIDSVLRESGIRTGLYTSPHLIDFNERIAVSGRNVSDDELCALMDGMIPVVDDMQREGMQCTFFEVTTAIAFLHFARMKVEYAVVEVGMGGRFDATNLILPEVSVITNISLEHTAYLGDTVEKIAFEKAGIIKEKVPVITVNKGGPLEVIRTVASSKGSELIAIDDVSVISLEEDGVKME